MTTFDVVHTGATESFKNIQNWNKMVFDFQGGILNSTSCYDFIYF